METGRASGFPKTTVLLIYPLTLFSLALPHSHGGPILIEAVGSEIRLNSGAALQHFGHQSWLFKSRANLQCSGVAPLSNGHNKPPILFITRSFAVITPGATSPRTLERPRLSQGVLGSVCVCVCPLSYIQTGSLVTTSITNSFTNDWSSLWLYIYVPCAHLTRLASHTQPYSLRSQILIK